MYFLGQMPQPMPGNVTLFGSWVRKGPGWTEGWHRWAAYIVLQKYRQSKVVQQRRVREIDWCGKGKGKLTLSVGLTSMQSLPMRT